MGHEPRHQRADWSHSARTRQQVRKTSCNTWYVIPGSRSRSGQVTEGHHKPLVQLGMCDTRLYESFYSYNAIVRLKKWFGSMLGHGQVDTRSRSGQNKSNFQACSSEKMVPIWFSFYYEFIDAICIHVGGLQPPKNGFKKLAYAISVLF